jgi:perosamine synthetase
MSSPFIPISRPYITEKEVEYVTEAVRSTWISSLGKYIDRFEQEFAVFCDSKYAVSTGNGTLALHLALYALGVKAGDEVIVPDLSFIATANTVLHVGATPVFADIDPYNLCIDPQKIESLITKRTKAIMPVHLYGHPADMEAINAIAKKHGLLVIEDAAEAHGATINGKKVGNWGKCGCFSFYGNKNITTGEGGMITTDDEHLYQRLRYLRDHAMSKEKRYWHTESGFNFRITNLQAAIGCAQMEKADRIIERRREIFDLYSKELNGIRGVRLNRTSEWAKNSYWLICLESDSFNEAERSKFMDHLKKNNIDSRPYFYPMSAMPYFKPADTPATHKVYQTGVNLPTFYEITEENIRHIGSVIKAYFK